MSKANSSRRTNNKSVQKLTSDQPKPDEHDAPIEQVPGEQIELSSPDEVRQQQLEKIRQDVRSAKHSELERLLTKSVQTRDLPMQKIINDELTRRFEAEREKQQLCQLEFRYSDFKRDGYGVSKSLVPRRLKTQRLTHQQGRALARIHLAMMEGGEKFSGNRPVASKEHVIARLLELADEQMEK